MIQAGIGETHVNAFLTTLGIPPISFNTIKFHERRVGKHIEYAARQSCSNASQTEYQLALQKANTINFEEALELLEMASGKKQTQLSLTVLCARS